MQISPSPVLSSLIKHYLYLEAGTGHYRLFTDGHPGIVFNLGEAFLLTHITPPVSTIQRGHFLYGQQQAFSDLVSNEKLALFVIVLRPCSVYRLLGLPAFECNNQAIPLSTLFDRETVLLSEKIAMATDLAGLVKTVEHFFIQRLAQFKEVDPLFLNTLDHIYLRRGSVEIGQLLQSIPVSERQLERKFKHYVGLSPKKFCEIVQFHSALNHLRSARQDSVASAAYECGYFDPSHLNVYFRKLAGITPLQYRQQSTLLAVNFLELGFR